MAIEIAFNTKFGDTYTTAYSRIVNMTLDYVNQCANVQVGIYRSSEDRKEGKSPVEIETYIYKGEEFEKIFAEVSVEKVGDTINPVRSIYEDIVKKDSKYEEGKKLYDEVVSDKKEISKEEAIKLEAEGVPTEEKAVAEKL
jgi:hypothetical protein